MSYIGNELGNGLGIFREVGIDRDDDKADDQNVEETGISTDITGSENHGNDRNDDNGSSQASKNILQTTELALPRNNNNTNFDSEGTRMPINPNHDNMGLDVADIANHNTVNDALNSATFLDTEDQLSHDVNSPDNLSGPENPSGYVLSENSGLNLSGSNLQANQVNLASKATSNEFVRKLFMILEKNQYRDIVRWTDSGDSFVVLDTGKFTTKVLPSHFKHSNFASFVRQLNKYDFHKVKRTAEEKQNSVYGELSWEFKHPHFRIHDEAGLDNIKRKTPSQKKMNLSDGTRHPNLGLGDGFESSITQHINNMVSKDSFNALKKRVDKLDKELSTSKLENYDIKLGFQKLNSKYNTLIESLITFKTVNEKLVSNFNTICSTLAAKGVEIPSNILNSMSTASSSPNPIFVKQKNVPINGERNMDDENAIRQTGSGSGILHISTTPNVGDIGGNNPMSGTLDSSLADKKTIMSNQTTTYRQDINGLKHLKAENSDTSLSGGAGNLPALRKGFHVLLVEDDTVSIELCSKFLKRYGCTVQVVTDGLSAISKLEKFRYDLVLMDIVMPNLDGATATSVIRGFDNQTPIIAMTGNIEDQDLITYLQHGMNDILAKPFTRDDLHSMLVRYLKDRIPLCDQPPQGRSQAARQLSEHLPHQQPSPNVAGSSSQHNYNMSISPVGSANGTPISNNHQPLPTALSSQQHGHADESLPVNQGARNRGPGVINVNDTSSALDQPPIKKQHL